MSAKIVENNPFFPEPPYRFANSSGVKRSFTYAKNESKYTMTAIETSQHSKVDARAAASSPPRLCTAIDA